MKLKAADIAGIVKIAIKENKIIQQNQIAAELNIKESQISRIINSGGASGRLDNWLGILDLCGFEIEIKSKNGFDHTDLPVEATASKGEFKSNGTAAIDTDLHKNIITAVENFLAEEGLALPPDKKAEVIALLYELYSDTGKTIEGETVKRYLRLVA